jgi:hypothetical protein
MSNTAEHPMDRRYQDTRDVIAHIREQAAALVLRVNQGRVFPAAALSAKTAEVAEAMTRKVCLDLSDQGRADLARKIRLAWETGA